MTLKAARDIGRKSVVLLKNNQEILPLKKDIPNIALIGPMIKAPIVQASVIKHSLNDLS